MLSIIGNRKIIVSILTMVFLIVGGQGINYAQAAPDLRVSLEVSPTSVAPGGNITLTATVRNHGDERSGDTTLTYYRRVGPASNPIVGSPIGSMLVSALAAGDESTFSISLAAPSPILSPTIPTQTYYYYAQVDPVAGEDPTDPTNNQSNVVTLQVTNVRPNLTVTLTSPYSYNVYNPTYGYYNPVVPGGTFTLVATVRNDGDGVSSTDLRNELVVYRTPATSPGLPEVTQSIQSPSDPTLNRGESDTYTITMRAPFQPGTYNYYVTLPSVPGDATTRRNSNTVLITTSSADLVVDTPTVNKSTLAPGESFTLTATVRNNGIGNSSAATLRYYRSTDATISNDSTSGSVDTEVGTADTISALSGYNTANQVYPNTSTQTVELTAPSEPGTYYYGACVSTTLESRSDNNCSSAVTVTVTAPPDLVAELFELRGTSTLAPGERFTLDATVTNEGVGQSATTTLRFYESTDRRFRSEDEVGRVSVRALASNISSTENIRLIAPSEPGTYYYRVHVDEVANEAETTNNWSSYIVVFVEAPLTIESLQPSKFALAPGERFTLTATIKNDGDTTSARTTVEYYRSDDDSITSRDTSLGTDTVSAIAARRTTQVSRSLTAPNAGGTYYYGVCVGDDISSDTCAVIKVSVVGVLIRESQRPPMYWVDAQAGTLQNLTGSSVDRFVQSVQNATGVAVDAAAGKVYWTEDMGNKTGRIRRANLDGTNVQLIRRVTGVPKGIAIDASRGKLYLIHSWGKVQQLDLNGENYQFNFISNLDSPQGIAVDAAGGKVYWTERMSDTAGRIRRANLDGTNVQLVRELTGVPQGIGVDPTNRRLYVANSQGQVHRLDLDGRNFQANFILNLNSPQGIAVDVRAGKFYWTEEGKIRRANLDGRSIQSVATGVGTPAVLAVSTTTFAVLIPEAQRPPIYWQTQAGTLQNLTGASVDSFAQTVQNATGLAVDTTRGRVYWTEQTSARAGRIRRANLNGANVQLVRELTGVPRGIAIDASRGRLYIINSQGTLQRLNVDGTNFEANLVRNLSSPNGIAVDAGRGKVYWTEDLGNKTGRIQRANLDGTNVQLIRKVTGIPRGIAIDTSRGKLYVAHSWGKVQQLDLNGENYQSNFIPNLDSPQGIAVDAAGARIYWTARGKIQRANMNGRNIQDVVTGLATPVGIALNAPAARGGAASAPAAAAMAPNATALHANYPNPFNPETWIPYQLQKPADVQISIYNQSGILIRELSLGYQAAGQYISRSRAAYWDGRNQVGEPVASGLYFYTLTAGDFSATRKMLILK
ncbi:hypothetical protein C6503_00620 [Candidatus Poribacteria bacterium]|nr:MAG: hypothetical protein C6503_00620 [Candidatus Poribacteria bacterium]